MKILIDKEFEIYNNNLSNNNGKIKLDDSSLLEIDSRGEYIVPGFIDTHIHGAGNYDTMMDDKNAVNEISKVIVKEGTTSFLPTTMTFELGQTKKVLSYINNSINNTSGARVLGAHLEGPFISKDFIGAQNPEFQTNPSVQILKDLDPLNVVKKVTYAAELDEDLEFTKYLANKKIIASVGHSAMSCDDCLEATKSGLNSITHFHNAHSAHHHRTPGIVTAGFLSDDLNVEVIADNIHVNKNVLNMIYKVKGYENISLITDSMCAKWMEDGIYELGGQRVIKKGNEARLEDGTLAGSVLKLNEGVKNMFNLTDAQLSEVILMASYTPSKMLKKTDLGLIKEDYLCDIVVLDKNLDVIQTFVGGQQVYVKKGE